MQWLAQGKQAVSRRAQHRESKGMRAIGRLVQRLSRVGRPQETRDWQPAQRTYQLLDKLEHLHEVSAQEE
jgi:hypothetical protein